MRRKRLNCLASQEEKIGQKNKEKAMKTRFSLLLVMVIIISLVLPGCSQTTPTPTLVPVKPTTVVVPVVPTALPVPAPTITSVAVLSQTMVVEPKLTKVDPTPRVAVESAFTAELDKLLAETSVERKYVINGNIYTIGKLRGNNVLLFLSQVSMTNAAMSTQTALDYFNVTHLVFSGIAGGVNDALNIGDVVVPSRWAEYQEFTFARENPDGSFAGSSDLPNFGMMFPSAVSAYQKGGEAGKTVKMSWFPVDTNLLKVAEGVAAKVSLEKCGVDKDKKPSCLTASPQVKVGGNGVSGPTFVDNAAFRKYAWEVFKADSLDMESAAVAHVAYSNAVPFLVFRSLSDLAGGGKAANEIGIFFQLAADNSAKVLLAFLEAWSATSNKTPAPPVVGKPVVFGMIMVGPYNDHGWSEAHFVAGQYVEKNLPGAKMIYLDKVNSADRKGVTLDSVVADMVSKGVKIIFTTSDDFQPDTRTAAAKYKDVTFINISGDDAATGKGTPNLSNYMGKMEYGKMIAGCAAAMTTQTGKLAYLGPLINDETRRLASSAYLGAKYCWTTYRGKQAADLKFDVKWIGFWFNIPGVTLDPTKVANDFFAGGADVILSGIDTTEGQIVAGQLAKQGKKVWAIPYDFKDACSQTPEICLGVPYFNWGPGYLKILKEFQAGTLKQFWTWDGPDWKNINNPDTSAIGFLAGLALIGDAKAKTEVFTKGLSDGSINLFIGPLNFQDGSAYLKAGEKAVWEKNVWYLPQLLQGMTGPSK
jgi:simple sugar transport system substrate-binding protein